MEMYNSPKRIAFDAYLKAFDFKDESCGLSTEFVKFMETIEKPKVLELGTLRSNKAVSTMHRNFVPHAGEYVGTDAYPGLDVDFMADIHEISKIVGEEVYDAVISCSSFEHFKYPHLAAHEIMKIVKVGGALFVQTHQTFPLHSYPYDYFRFSQDAILGLFGTKMGFECEAGYEFPATVFAKRMPDAITARAFLNVVLFGRKTAPTPKEYIYELDSI